MKTHLFVLLILAMVVSCSEGGMGSHQIPSPEVRARSAPASNAFVVVDADFLTYELVIRSGNGALSKQIDHILTAKTLLLEKVTTIDGYVGHQSEPPRVIGSVEKTGLVNSLRNRASVLLLRFQHPEDPLVQLKQLTSIVDEVAKSGAGDFDVAIGKSYPELGDPESRRDEVVEKALRDLGTLKTLDSNQFTIQITGFARPLTVAPYGSNQFILSLPYSIDIRSVQTKESGNSDANPSGDGVEG